MNNQQKSITYPLVILATLFLLTGCSDVVEGGAHMAYGFSTFMMGVLKFFIFIAVAVLIFGFIGSLFKSK